MKLEVLHDCGNLSAASFRIDHWLLEVLNEHGNLATFGRKPKVPWDVKHDGLEEQDESHPLVVLVVDLLGSFGQISLRRNSRMRNVHSLPSDPPEKKRKHKFRFFSKRCFRVKTTIDNFGKLRLT